jgi:hypothetical protein
MRNVFQVIIATSFTLILATNSVYSADDACTEALNKAIERWDRSINTYTLKPIKKTFTEKSEEWKLIRKNVSDTALLSTTIELQGQLNKRELKCLQGK